MKETYLSRDFRLRALHILARQHFRQHTHGFISTSKFYSKLIHRFFSDTSCKMTKRMV